MQNLINIKRSFVISLLLMITITGVSCSPASVIENPVSKEQPVAVTDVPKPISAEQKPSPENTFGISVVAKSLCSDGIKTTLTLQTDLDPNFWQLSENDFYPNGQSYFETSILFLENNEIYSNVSSGKRDDPVFDSQKKSVSTTQTFVFPKTPIPNAEFTVKANVTLADLPESYIPPAGVSFTEPGIIKVPMEYVTSTTLGDCP